MEYRSSDMWIKTERTRDGLPVVTRRKVKGEMIEFTDNGTANVSKEIGEYLVNNYDEYLPTEEE